jgi:hypothetical protein
MPRKKKTIQPESEDEVYERFLKKLLKDPRFKQYKPMAIKALAARGFGGGGRGRGGGGGRGGRSAGMLQTPNQDNFIKIHSAILETNSKLADLSNQMKRGGFDQHSYMTGYYQGMQGNSQPSSNIPPPTAASTPQSLLEHKILTARPYRSESTDEISDDEMEGHKLLLENYREHLAEQEGEQGHAEHSPNVLNVAPYEVHDSGTQTDTRMYDTNDMLSVMSHTSILARLRSHGFDTKKAPTGIDTLRESVGQLYDKELKDRIQGVPGAVDLNLMQSGPRGRPRLNDPIIEPAEDGEED